MVKRFVKQFGIFFFAIILFSCSSANNKPLLIGFSADSSAIVFDHINRAGLLQLQNDSLDGDSVLNDLVSVLQTPSELDSTLKELPVEGKVVVTDSNLVFIPKVPFVKGRDYLVVTHLNARFGTVKELLKSELKPGVRTYRQLLKR
ncbi:MAG: hypothetical protein P0Y49_20630 [Candidatus Pedobacter colombiensis]|uniref:Lipoprotein n=1 Tax=Candidatus Pedobacter colombiensis TaxID=3121371 RepID=A0AAJ6B5W1_9SPHI|nr:hypothetical protein [Pedobacter sp.]WEK19187.1 MAG: hypothetical protein P0Y49_20630 [Pedobacter sp.]